MNGCTTIKPKNLISSILGGTPGKPKPLAISNPHDFRQVSIKSYIEVYFVYLITNMYNVIFVKEYFLTSLKYKISFLLLHFRCQLLLMLIFYQKHVDV